jgi:branched-chain amino acid transport system ATP-binding protein
MLSLPTDAAHLATGPRLLLADESLGGLDAAEMDQAAAMLQRIRCELGITIIWVEHIMGVLMRIVDPFMVLRPRREDRRGSPGRGSGRPACHRGLSRNRAATVQAAAAHAS